MNDFMQGFVKGAKETPRIFFAPLIAIWRLLISASESVPKQEKHNHSSLV